MSLEQIPTQIDGQYSEDTASVAGEKVMMAGVVRTDTTGSLVDSDGDRTVLQVDPSGGLRVVQNEPVYIEFPSHLGGSPETITALNDNVEASIITGGRPNVVFDIDGTWIATLRFEAKVDFSLDWFPVPARNIESDAISTTTSVNGRFVVPTQGMRWIRVIASAYTSGTADVVWTVAPAVDSGDVHVMSSAPLPAGSNNIGDVDVVSSALPTGAATETTIGAISTATGAQADAEASGNGSVIAILKRLRTLLNGGLPAALGAGGGVKVDGSGTALPVSGTVTANAGTNLNTSSLALDATVGTTNTEVGATNETAASSDTATSGLNGRLQRIAQRLTSLIALFPSALVGGRFDVNNGAWLGSTAPTVGQKTGANSVPVVLASDQAELGIVTETAPASDTASSGLNGRLQRIAQRLTSLIALLPTALGQGTMAQSLRVVLPSDQASIPVAATLQASTNTQEVVGDVAHDSPVGGNPLLNGFEARTSDGTAVANGDVVRGAADTLGKEVVLLGAVHDLHVNGKGTFTNTTAADIIAAQGAGIRIVVTSVLVTNAHATVGTKVEIRDGTTVKIPGYAAAAGGGFALNAGGAPLMISTANTAVTARAVTTGADVDVFISGYQIKN